MKHSRRHLAANTGAGAAASRALVGLVGLLLLSSSTLVTLASASTVHAADPPVERAASRAPGKLTLSRTSTAAGATGNYTLTLSAPKARIRGTMRLILPGGWTHPQTTRPTEPGYVKLARGRCATANLTKLEKLTNNARRLVISIDCAKGRAATITYRKATAPRTAGTSIWPATARFNTWGEYLPMTSQPTVDVTPRAPAALVASFAPSDATARTPIDPVIFEVRDRYGNLATRRIPITASLSGCPTGHLSGTTTLTSGSNGIVTFTGLQVDRACETARLTASSDSLTQATSTVIMVAGNWQTVATAPHSIFNAATAQLADGRILIASGTIGLTGAVTAASYTYDPATHVFTRLQDVPTPRVGGTSVQLDDGRVIVFGGRENTMAGEPYTQVDAWDPVTGEWSSLSPRTIASPGSYHDYAAVLPDGQVLVVANDDWESTPMLYDPEADAWSLTGQLHHPDRTGFSWAPLDDGRVLIYGGWTGPEGFIGFPEVYDPDTGEWVEVTNSPGTRAQATATVLHDGRVLLIGGYPNIGGSNLAPDLIYDASTDSWSTSGWLALRRQSVQAVARSDGTIVIAGGDIEGQSSYPERRQRTESRSIDGTWTTEAPLIENRYGFGTLLFTGSDDAVIALGGDTVEQFY